MKALVERSFAKVVVLSYAEVVPGVQVENIATIEAHAAVGRPGMATDSAILQQVTWSEQKTDVTTSATDTGWLVEPDDPEDPQAENGAMDWNQ
ncbi:MAG: hypothetical protein JWM90_901 [Thermoleophilia bacterium]|nr:hypothetical protein [Thermoleophilia bacterium]